MSRLTSAFCHSRMSEKSHVYEAWNESVISEEKGNRIIHFYLRSTTASPLLAAVATEKAGRHFIYTVSKDYLETFEPSPGINAHTKWTSKEPVRDWLVSLVRKDNLPPTKPDLHQVTTVKGSGSLDTIAASEPSCIPEPSGVQLGEPTPSEQALFQVGDDTELLCQDLDMPDCWYKCKIMDIFKRCWKVRYNDMKDEEGSGNLEQNVSPPRLARPDKLSLRHSGRLTIRPCPPEEASPTTYEVGAAVDAWWNNGWCEGLILTGESLSSSDNYHVFLPGNAKFLTLHRRDLRASWDWVNNIWVAVKPHPDVLDAIFSHIQKRDE